MCSHLYYLDLVLNTHRTCLAHLTGGLWPLFVCWLFQTEQLLLLPGAFAVGGAVVVEDQPDVSAVLSAYNQQGDPTLYEEYYSGLKHFIECSLDCHRAELSQLFYPLFVHMYLELVYNQHESEAKSFFER